MAAMAVAMGATAAATVAATEWAPCMVATADQCMGSVLSQDEIAWYLNMFEY